MRNSGLILRIGGALLALAVVAAAVVLLLREPKQKHVTAYFTRSVGLYKGADVRILGIPVGKVTKVQPVGPSVKVEMTYDAKYKVPSDAYAVIVNQTLVADRYVQFTPVYKGGATLADKATLTTARTQVPVEVDEVGSSLSDLSKALGPQGANKDGALSRLLQTGADTLQGTGDDFNSTIHDSSKALSTLSQDREDVAKTISNLRVITDTLRENDDQVRSLTGHLNSVSGQLAGEKDDLTAALRTLGPTLRNVQQFVRQNRDGLSTNVRQLAQVTGTLVKEKDSFAELLAVAPLAINNLARAYDPISGTIHNRADLRQFHDLADWVCSLAYSVGTPPKQCLDFVRPYNGIGKALTGLSLDLSWITALTTHYDPVPIPPDAYGPGEERPGTKSKGASGKTGQPSTKPSTKKRDFTALLPGGTR
ncbi:MCE family protein [Actinomadura rupiterrae]|uniref:MCE family protein n=1 Tax=Actinomadura rupiterrae TaxID=559627 RepID=UPI0020A23FB4|nr:MCE family protein [Actinomadura rupiterrae]MCP2343346.1 phospholipid/cholesterol/gamma-HCH transport system substrate-binding protein [Actinomadura rupiterrae]